MDRGSGGRPYVHSNANNFMNDVGKDNLGETIVATQNIKNSLITLEQIRDSLRDEAKAFLMGFDSASVTDQLLKLPDTYAGIAANIIQNSNVIASLVVSSSEGYVSKKQLSEILTNKEGVLEQTVLEAIGPLDEVIPVERLARIMGALMGDKTGKITISPEGTEIQQFFSFDKSASTQLTKMYAEGCFNRLKSSKANSMLVKRIKDILLAADITNKYDKSQMVHSVDKFMQKFRKIFLSEVNEVYFWPIDYPPEMYLIALEDELRNSLTKDIIDFRNAAGKTNEEVLAAVYKADTSVTIHLTATGEKTEEQIIQEFPSLHTMNTHHGSSKQSQTDMVIQNKNGMVVRAQSKTSKREFIIDLDNNPTIRILNHLQRSMNVYTLLKSLNETGTFPIPNIDDICYAIANSLWFNTHCSVSGKRTVGYFDIKEAKRPDILPQVVKALTAALAQQAPSFLGVSVERTEKEIIADVKGSNIFYIENGNLIPTYVELDEIIRDLKVYIGEAEAAPQMLKFYIENAGGESWVYENEEAFWLAKNAHSSYNPEPGHEQGAAAISSTSIRGDFRALMKLDDYVLDY